MGGDRMMVNHQTSANKSSHAESCWRLNELMEKETNNPSPFNRGRSCLISVDLRHIYALKLPLVMDIKQ